MKKKHTTNPERITWLEKKIAAYQHELKAQRRKKKELARKQRTRTLIQAGGLVQIAGLIESDPGLLLGTLLEVKEHLHDTQIAQQLKEKGDALLMERERQNRARKKYIPKNKKLPT